MCVKILWDEELVPGCVHLGINLCKHHSLCKLLSFHLQQGGSWLRQLMSPRDVSTASALPLVQQNELQHQLLGPLPPASN